MLEGFSGRRSLLVLFSSSVEKAVLTELANTLLTFDVRRVKFRLRSILAGIRSIMVYGKKSQIQLAVVINHHNEAAKFTKFQSQLDVQSFIITL